MLRRGRRKGDGSVNKDGWLLTYADMITLLLCFFVIMFSPDDVEIARLEDIATTIQVGGIGFRPGGHTIAQGRLADLGNTLMTLPSMERGRHMGTAVRRAISVFSPEIRSEIMKVTHDERGLVITLAGDAFFHSASATINIETTRDVLIRLGAFMADPELANRRFRIEGHSDSIGVDPAGPWADNWQLSVERSRSVLNYLVGLGIDEQRFQIAGFAHTRPVATNATPEGRANNRRVDVIILDDGHL